MGGWVDGYRERKRESRIITPPLTAPSTLLFPNTHSITNRQMSATRQITYYRQRSAPVLQYTTVIGGHIAYNTSTPISSINITASYHHDLHLTFFYLLGFSCYW